MLVATELAPGQALGAVAVVAVAQVPLAVLALTGKAMQAVTRTA